jgi:hypothetical protein
MTRLVTVMLFAKRPHSGNASEASRIPQAEILRRAQDDYRAGVSFPYLERQFSVTQDDYCAGMSFPFLERQFSVTQDDRNAGTTLPSFKRQS